MELQIQTNESRFTAVVSTFIRVHLRLNRTALLVDGGL